MKATTSLEWKQIAITGNVFLIIFSANQKSNNVFLFLFSASWKRSPVT